TAPKATQKSASLPLFSDVSSLINHHHHENDFAEFQRQTLLPKMLSQPGPGLAWCDLHGNGHDDLIISSGAGGSLAVYRNLGNGKLELITNEVVRSKTGRDQTSVLGWTPAPGQRELLIGMSNYEDGKSNGPAVLRLDWNSGKPTTIASIPATA